MMKSGFHLMGFLLSAGMLLSSCSTGLRVNPMITQEELVASVGFLASDSLKGRYPGTPEDSVLSAYLADALKSAGASLLFEEGRQYFDVTVSLVPAPDNVLVYGGKNASADHFTPMDFSGGTAPEAELLVLGYGFEIDEPDLRWDDYSGADVQGRWVLLLRGDPEPENPRSAFAAHSEDYSKVITARDHGAAGVLLVSGPGWDAADQLTRLSERRGNAGIPVLHIRRALADSLLAGAGTSVEKLESLLNNTRKPRILRTGMVVEARAGVVERKAGTSNVVALLPGVDSLLKDEYILLGAHKDHLGMGGTGSSSRHPDTVAVHNGADDNASGLAALLEIAQKIGAQRQQLRRSLLLVAFGAEEMGLIGSKYFADNPPVPLQQVVAMVNLDMVGRLKSDSTLAIGGTGTSEHSENLLNGLPRDPGLKLAFAPEGYGPSDHATFYGRNIPVFFLSTGPHLAYHTPSDDPDSLDYEGLRKIAEYAGELTWALANLDQALAFREAGPKESMGRYSRRGKGVTLGIMPDVSGVVKEGLRADVVMEGRPAHMGGMRSGDVITAINGKPVGDVYEYMHRLAELKAGQIIEVEVLRGGSKETLIIQL
jgi:aminopeptidase YwaD